MLATDRLSPTERPPIPKASFRPAAAGILVAGSLLHGLGVGYLIWEVGLRWAPWLLLPALAGLVGGMTWCAAVRMVQIGHLPTLAAGAVLSITVAAITPHYVSYRSFEAEAHDQLRLFAAVQERFGQEAGERPLLPRTFVEFLSWSAARGREITSPLGSRRVCGVWAWASWGLDAVIIAVTFSLPLRRLFRQPYCGQCGSWFQTIRSGSIEGDAARRLRELASTELPPSESAALYQVRSCRGGCGPVLLEVRDVGTSRSGAATRRWLARQAVGQLWPLLDEATTTSK